MRIANPILPGFHPDPSIVWADGRYVIATSTFEWFPGIALHASTDLVRWAPIGHALTDRAALDLGGIPDSGGVWAPSIDHRDGLFRIVYSVVRTVGGPYRDADNYLVVAERPEGPWSAPVYLNSAGFDPALFTDVDGRDHLVTMRWDHRPDRSSFAGIEITELDVAAGRLVGAPRLLLTHDVLVEGPNLYHHDGWYHLLLAEGGTGWNHGIRQARSRHLDGPYELAPEPLLTSRDDVGAELAKAGHGELVRTPGGDRYLVHLASRPVWTFAGPRCVLGRETCLQRVEWTGSGWLRLAGGGHRAAITVEVAPSCSNAAGPAADAAPEPVEPEPFDPAGLDLEWMSPRRPVDPSWADLASRPGWLRLRGRQSPRSLFDSSLLARRLTSTRATARTVLDFVPTRPHEMAGLVCWYNTSAHHYLRLTHDEERGRVLGVVSQQEERATVAEHLDVPVEEWPLVHLRADLDGAQLRFAASPDGRDWVPVGPVLDATLLSDDAGRVLRFTGATVGICAQDLYAHGAWAAFGGFTLSPR